MSYILDRKIEGKSKKWVNWQSKLTIFTCYYCYEKHGTIFSLELPYDPVPVHINCQCELVPMRTVRSGQATNMGLYGADNFLMSYRILPDYYLTKEEAEKMGWMEKKGNLSSVLPGVMIGGNIYKNKDYKLPTKLGRIWYEADINYISGYRNGERILYSNDGLIFVSYDHYKTFYEVTK